MTESQEKEFDYFADMGNFGFVACRIVEEDTETTLQGKWFKVELAREIPHPHFGTQTTPTIEASKLHRIPCAVWDDDPEHLKMNGVY